MSLSVYGTISLWDGSISPVGNIVTKVRMSAVEEAVALLLEILLPWQVIYVTRTCCWLGYNMYFTASCLEI